MVCSMTGFARTEANHPWGTVLWEIRSVNHRYLEPHFRLPDNMRVLESDLRNQLRQQLGRGKVEMTLQLQLHTDSDQGLRLNQNLLSQLAHTIETINELDFQLEDVNPLALLQWPGVIETDNVDMEAVHKAALSLFDQALKQVIEHRSREGLELQQFIEQRLVQVSDEVVKIRQHLPALQQAQKDKMLERLAALQTDINQDRLEQELVFYAQKTDVEEELDRLNTHVNEVRHVLTQQGAIGRRLDFLMQELNREANTLASKSIATPTTQSAMELKIIIEQMREQIQNIE